MYCINIESKITINLPEKTSNNKDLPKKRLIEKRIIKKLRYKSQYFILVLFIIPLYKNGISKDCKVFLLQLLIIKIYQHLLQKMD